MLGCSWFKLVCLLLFVLNYGYRDETSCGHWNVVCAITFDEESFGVGTDTLLVLFVIVIESFAMGADIVLVFACNRGCMPVSCTDLLFSCWDAFSLRLCASFCLYSTMVTETHRLCIGMFKSFYMG